MSSRTLTAHPPRRLSTYGHAQLRQDEGGPKLLNDFSPADNQFGGGLGYLVDSDSGDLMLTTRYVGSKASPQQHYQREYGVGYARRTLSTTSTLPQTSASVPGPYNMYGIATYMFYIQKYGTHMCKNAVQMLHMYCTIR